MAAKPETRYTDKIHRKLPSTIYHMKNNNPYIGGIPDNWYSGMRGDLWVEYKYLERVPTRATVAPLKLLSALQAQWLHDRYCEGRNVAVVIGCPLGGVLLTDLAWQRELSAENFKSLILSNESISEWITNQVA